MTYFVALIVLVALIILIGISVYLYISWRIYNYVMDHGWSNNAKYVKWTFKFRE